MANNELSDLAKLCVEYVGAYHERTRAFNALNNLELPDDERKIFIQAYGAAVRKFDDLRIKLLKS